MTVEGDNRRRKVDDHMHGFNTAYMQTRFGSQLHHALESHDEGIVEAIHKIGLALNPPILPDALDAACEEYYKLFQEDGS